MQTFRWRQRLVELYLYNSFHDASTARRSTFDIQPFPRMAKRSLKYILAQPLLLPYLLLILTLDRPPESSTTLQFNLDEGLARNQAKTEIGALRKGQQHSREW